MTNKKHRLVLQAISHWEKNANISHIREADISPKSCPLCVKYMETRCGGCPVAEKTGEALCVGTPYYAAHDIVERYRTATTVSGADLGRFLTEFQEIAIREIAFLQTVLTGEDASAPR